MTVDLACVAANAIWGFVLVMLEITGKTRTAGPAWNAGNRDEAPAFAPWIERAGRALHNHKENFPFFLAAVVVVHLAGKHDRVCDLAAVVYVIARVLHAVLYIAGVKGLRSIAFTAGLLATFTIWSRLLF